MRSDANGTVSGRFSSSTPNLQNIPQHSEDGAQIRELFLPEAGEKWWKYDLSQIEYRLMVHDAATLELLGAAEIVEMYKNDPATDFHKATSEMTGLDRTAAKRINFGIAYSMGVQALADRLDLELDEAKVFLRDYHNRVPFMRALSEFCKNETARLGEIRTLLNRRRCFNTFERVADDWARTRTTFTLDPNRPNPLSRPPGTERAYLYAALNARIQGSAADLMKKAMVDIHESGALDVLGAPFLTIHDELDGSFPNTKAARAALAEIKHLMENAVELLLPLRADGSTGANWGRCEESK